MRRNPWKISTLVLSGALALALARPLVSDADAQRPTQPHMQAALAAAQSAQRSLKKARGNKGGHRAAALGLLAKAEREITAGIAFSRK